MTNATPKQLAVLQALRNFRKVHGYSPTMQELADLLHLSKVTVFEHVGALERKKLLLREPHKARSLNVDPATRLPGEGSTSDLPLCGAIAAGQPIESTETPDTLNISELFVSRAGTFALRVRGDSMIEDHIADGDYVIIERRHTARDGEIVVALLEDGSATLKRFFREANRVRLQPANGSMRPIYVRQDVRIQGVLIGVVRSFPHGGLAVGKA